MKRLIFLLLLFGCSDDTAEVGIKQPENVGSEKDAEPIISGPMDGMPSLPDVILPDLEVLQQDSQLPGMAAPDASPPDAFVEPCDIVTTSEPEQYCFCHPQCCTRQQWYCPPNANREVEAIRITLDICGPDRIPCDFQQDEGCPPPEIIDRTGCFVTSECPPGSDSDSIEWFDCEPEPGVRGRQKVLCSKGFLLHGPCEPCVDEKCDLIDNDCDDRIDEGLFPCEGECGEGKGICLEGEIINCNVPEPQEEICDFEDNDCDGLEDEGQRNACDLCGQIPDEDCDDIDNDCDGLVDEGLVRECETICELGIERCIAGQWVSCSARQPIDEVCDGLDNDCDGRPDEQLECLCTQDQVGVLVPCAEPPLVCGEGFKTCECLDVDCLQLQMSECKALCFYAEGFIPGQNCNPFIGRPVAIEQCNNFDEDCDVAVDEGVSRPCYSGPAETLDIGICRAGTQTCFQGQFGGADPGGVWVVDICEDEIVPQEEVCNGADDDCDGEVDYGEEIRDTDILLIVDASGSMSEEIRAVLVALSRFAQHFSAEEAIQWGLIAGPFSEDNPHTGLLGEELKIISDISPFQDFLARFIALDPEDFDGGEEMLIDAVFLSMRNLNPAGVDLNNREWQLGEFSTPPLEQFVINWRPNTDRIVIVFTDEDEQTYLRPPVGVPELVAAVRGAPNTVVHTFALPFYGWDEIARDCGGEAFDLTSNAVQMYNDLMSILDEVCLPREEEEQGAFIIFRGNYVYASYPYELICY